MTSVSRGSHNFHTSFLSTTLRKRTFFYWLLVCSRPEYQWKRRFTLAVKQTKFNETTSIFYFTSDYLIRRQLRIIVQNTCIENSKLQGKFKRRWSIKTDKTKCSTLYQPMKRTDNNYYIFWLDREALSGALKPSSKRVPELSYKVRAISWIVQMIF